MLGPWDWKPSSGRMLLSVARHWKPMAPTGGMSGCDVREVARGTLAAADRGQTGRRYILAGENLSYLAAWKLFARVAGRPGPLLPAGPAGADGRRSRPAICGGRSPGTSRK